MSVEGEGAGASGLAKKLAPGAPKRLLAIDGGGIRALIAIEILAAIERHVAAPLGEYFDYVAGTSAGAIVASCIALGMSVERIKGFYLDAGPKMFVRARPWRRLYYKYASDPLARALKKTFSPEDGAAGPFTLGSPDLQTLLLLVMRNATTDSPWALSNNPRGRYNAPDRGDCNLRIPLWQLVRASAAAPTYFPPERVKVGSQEFLFVDGGVTPYNNPAFLLFLQATLEPYRLQWPTGPEKLLIVSVGTGTAAEAKANLLPRDLTLLHNARHVPSALIHAAMNEQDLLCRIFGCCRHGAPLDEEVGDLLWSAGHAGHGLPKLFSYLRYTADLSRDGLDGLGLPHLPAAGNLAIDSIRHMDDLQAIGQAASAQVIADHFAGFRGPG